jgi:magnesium transporter
MQTTTDAKNDLEGLLKRACTSRAVALAIAGTLRRSCQPDELASLHAELEAASGLSGAPAERDYFDTPMLHMVAHRFPWLFGLMMLQSVSGFVVEHFEALISQHIVLAAFLTMLVGGGGNSSGQTVAELVKRMGTGDLNRTHFVRVLVREVAVGALLAVGLGLGAYPRVRLLSRRATDLDAVSIALSYVIIVIMANAIGVLAVFGLSLCGMASVGAPPVVQVVVDVLGILLTCVVALAILGVEEEGVGGMGVN